MKQGNYGFQLEQLAEGVWVALDTPGSGCGANAGIIDLGGRTILFDTLQTPMRAAELGRAAEELTGRPVSLVINSHFHSDHLMGNQLFPGVPVVATREIRELHAQHGAHYLQTYRERGPAYLAQQEEKLAAMAPGPEREAFAVQLSHTRHLVAAAPETELILPDVLIEGRLTLTGSKRTVEIQAHKGHTASDLICWLPAEQICFTGDLVLVSNHLWMGHGDPVDWFTTLDRLEELGVKQLVPGHGRVGGPEWIGQARGYIQAVVAQVAEEVARGTTPAEAAKLPVPAPYQQWDFPTGFAWNMQALVERLTAQKG